MEQEYGVKIQLWTDQCSGKIITECFTKYSPGFMCVRRKTHVFGNERHKVCCGLTSILLRAHIVEGKDFPSQRGAKQHQELGNAVGLMLRM